MENNQVKEVVDATLARLKDISNADCIIGKTIETKAGKVIPICKASIGFVSGGGEIDIKKKVKEYPFAGGSSGGLSLAPIGFLVITDRVQFLSAGENNAFDKICDFATRICEEIKGK